MDSASLASSIHQIYPHSKNHDFTERLNIQLNRLLARHRISLYAFVSLTWFLPCTALLAAFLAPGAANYQTLSSGLDANLFPVISFYALVLSITALIDLSHHKAKTTSETHDPVFHPFWILFLLSLAPVIIVAIMMGQHQ